MLGRIVHRWSTLHSVIYDAKLLPNGNLIYASKLKDSPLSNLEGTGGVIAIDVGVATTETIFEAEFTTIDFAVSQNLQWNDTTQAQGYLMHEVGQRIDDLALRLV